MGEVAVGDMVVGAMVVVDGGVEVVVDGWAWDEDTDMVLVRIGHMDQHGGSQDSTGHARMVARALETELGDVNIQAWDVMIVYLPQTANGVDPVAACGR